jgi:iron complex outermembrane receptor protein
MQQGALNTNRISIRGIGSRAQYGTQKKKRIMKGFL